MLQFDVALCRARDNVAHLSALVTRQAGKVRRYKSEVASGFMPDVPEFACLCRNGRQVPAGEERAFVRTHVVSTNNNQIRLRRISVFLPPASWGVFSGGSL